MSKLSEIKVALTFAGLENVMSSIRTPYTHSVCLAEKKFTSTIELDGDQLEIAVDKDGQPLAYKSVRLTPSQQIEIRTYLKETYPCI